MKKRIISIVLCLAMAVSLLPMLKPTVAEASGARVNYNTTAHTATVTWDAVAGASFYDVTLWNKYDGSGWYQPYVGPKVNAGQPLTYTFAASMFSGIADDGLTDQFKIAVRAWDSNRFLMETMDTPVFTSTLPTLAQPDVVLDDSGILTWSAVPDANEYNVSLYVLDTARSKWSAVSEDNRTADFSMDFSSLMVPGYQYKGRVRAMDMTHAHRSSGNRSSNTVTMPGEAVVGGVLNVGIDYRSDYPYTATAAWDGVQGAAAYWVTLEGMSDGTGVYPMGTWMAMDFAQKIEVKPGQVLQKEFGSSWFTDNAYEGIGNTYRVTVKAVNAAGMEIASGVSHSFDSNVPQLSAPTVTLDEKGVLTISEVANANDYHYSIYARNPGSSSQKGSLVTTSSSNSRTFDLRSQLTPGTEYVITAYARDNTNHYKTSASGTTGWFTWKEPDSHLFDIKVTGREDIYHNLRLDWSFTLPAASYEINVYHQADNASWVQEGETVVVEGTKNSYSLSKSYFQTAFDDPAFERSFANYYKIEVVARDGSGEELQTGGLYYTSTIDVIETPEVTLDGVTGYAEWGNDGEATYALYERPVGSSGDGTEKCSGSTNSSMIDLSADMRMGYEYRVSVCKSSYYKRTSGTAYSPWVESSQMISTVDVLGEVRTGIPLRSCLGTPAHSTIRIQSWTMNGQNVTDATYVVPGIQRVTLVLKADDGYVFDKNIGNLDVTVCGESVKTAHVSEDGKQLYITSQDFNNCDHSLSVADYEYDADQHWRTCSICGAEYGNAWHDMVLDTEKNVYRCSVCGYEEENSTKTLVKHVYIANLLGDTTGGYIDRNTIYIDSDDYDNFGGTPESIIWYRDNLSTPATEDYFLGGSTYYVCITARTQNETLCYMNSSTVFDAGSNSAYQPMGKPTVSSDGTQITQTFRVTLKDKEIDYVRFNGWPQVDDRLDTCMLDLTVNDAEHINASVQWYMNGKAVPADTTMIPGVAYAQVTLYADPGYCFAKEMRYFYMMGTITDYTRSGDGKYLTFTSDVLDYCDHSLNENDTYEHDSGDILGGGRHWITCSVCGDQIYRDYHSFPETTYHGTTTTMTCSVCGYSQDTSTNNGRKLVSTVTTESYSKYDLAAGKTPYTLGLKYGANPDISKNDERSAWYESDRTTPMTGTLQQGKTYYLKMVVYAPSKLTKYFDNTTQFVRGGSDALVAVGFPIVDPVDDSFITQWYKLYVAQLGDVNGDGAVNNLDLTKLLRHVAKIELLEDDSRADINDDGDIDAADVTALAKIIEAQNP